jgi:hypothetical protein
VYESNPEHRRAWLLRPTPLGQEALLTISIAQKTWADGLVAEFGEAKLKNATTLINRIRQVVTSMFVPEGRTHDATGFQAILIDALGRILLQDPDQGALSTLFAATEDIPGGSFVVPGGFGHMRGSPEIASVSQAARDVALARRLWDVSATLTGVDSIGR